MRQPPLVVLVLVDPEKRVDGVTLGPPLQAHLPPEERQIAGLLQALALVAKAQDQERVAAEVAAVTRPVDWPAQSTQCFPA
jgi:hypothetical protein